MRSVSSIWCCRKRSSRPARARSCRAAGLWLRGGAAWCAHAEKAKRRVWILCPDVKTQDHVHAELGVWQCPALYFPRLGPCREGALVDPELLAERTAVLSRMLEGESPVMVLCADSLDEPAPDLAEITEQKRMLKVGEKLDVEGLLKELNEAGYERVPVVTERGQFARRGGIVDFFSWQAEEPLRLEFFDDEWSPSAPSICTISRPSASGQRRCHFDDERRQRMKAGACAIICAKTISSDRRIEIQKTHRFLLKSAKFSESVGIHARILSGASPRSKGWKTFRRPFMRIRSASSMRPISCCTRRGGSFCTADHRMA
jgi:hypothetical protein